MTDDERINMGGRLRLNRVWQLMTGNDDAVLYTDDYWDEWFDEFDRLFEEMCARPDFPPLTDKQKVMFRFICLKDYGDRVSFSQIDSKGWDLNTGDIDPEILKNAIPKRLRKPDGASE